MNNSYSNMQNKEDITNTSGNLSKNLISTPSRFNQNVFDILKFFLFFSLKNLN